MERENLLKPFGDQITHLKDQSLWRLGTFTSDAAKFNVSSTDYLDLSNDPRVVDAACSAVQEFGAGGRVRILGGDLPLFRELEKETAQLAGFEDALMVSSGYTANVALLSTLIQKNDVVFSDQLVHASLIDGVRASGARYKIFRHTDFADLDRQFRDVSGGERRFVITDGLFSMDGTIAPISDLSSVCQKHGAFLIVDDAHGLATLGPKGEGSRGVTGGNGKIDILTGSYGKALGSQGGFIACSSEVREFLVNRCRPFFFSVSLPPATAAAALTAVRIARVEQSRRDHLANISYYFRQRLRESGYVVTGAPTSPIVGLVVGDARETVEVSKNLSSQGFFSTPVRPPAVPNNSSRIRFGLRSSLQDNDIERLLKAIKVAYPPTTPGPTL